MTCTDSNRLFEYLNINVTTNYEFADFESSHECSIENNKMLYARLTAVDDSDIRLQAVTFFAVLISSILFSY